MRVRGRVGVVAVLLVLLVGAALGVTWWLPSPLASSLSSAVHEAPDRRLGSADKLETASSTDDRATTLERAEVHLPPSRSVQHQHSERPLPIGSGDEALAKLERRADTGDLRAMEQLVRIYRMCPNKTYYQPARSSDVVSEVLGKFGDDPVFKHGDNAERQASREHFGEAVQRLCEDFRSIDRKKSLKNFWYWLQRAADAGDTTAMVNYAGNVVRTWPAVEGEDLRGGRVPLAHIEDIERYRQRAIGYLQTARQKGNPAALLILSQQYSTGSLFQLDLVKSCAYVLAFRSTSAMQSPVNRRSSWFLLAQLQDELDPAQLVQAQSMAKEIETNFVEQIRVGP